MHYLPKSSGAMIYLSMMRLMLRRLAVACTFQTASQNYLFAAYGVEKNFYGISSARRYKVVLENKNGSLTPLSVEGLPLLRSLLQSRHA